MENVRKHRNNKLITTKAGTNYLVAEPNYHTKEKVSDSLLGGKIKRIQILMNHSKINHK